MNIKLIRKYIKYVIIMFTIAFISASGGAGKTTLAINTAASLAIDGRKVLFIDFDPSAMATRVLLGRTFDECNLKTLMKKLVDYSRGLLKKRTYY